MSMSLAAGTVAAQSSLVDQGQPAAPRGSIKVSGYWLIDVRNADGSLASHTEFENALAPTTGGALLSKLLTGTMTASWLLIALDGATHPCTVATPWGSCWIAPPSFPHINSGFGFGSPFDDSFHNTSRTLAMVGQTVSPAKLVLTGTASTGGGTIDVVRTVVFPGCPHDPAPCDPLLTTSGGLGFQLPLLALTEFSLTGPGVHPINVTSGQVIQVSVTLSFSS
jgi:hypothetical protein